MGLSRRAYARHRGVAENAVRKAIAAGRITLEPDGTIDPEKADRDWATRTDPSQQRGTRAPSAPKAPREPVQDKTVPRAALDAVQKTLRESGDKAEGDVTFLRARTANEVIKAQERSVRHAKIKGELVDRARAVTTVFALARRERDAWVQWPAARRRADGGRARRRSASDGNGSRTACPTASRRALGRPGPT